MKYVNFQSQIDIPEAVVRCPDCAGPLWVEITEYLPSDGQISETGFYLHCFNQTGETDIHSDFIDWVPLLPKVYQWLSDNIRVAQVTKKHLDAWNEAAKDWPAMER